MARDYHDDLRDLIVKRATEQRRLIERVLFESLVTDHGVLVVRGQNGTTTATIDSRVPWATIVEVAEGTDLEEAGCIPEDEPDRDRLAAALRLLAKRLLEAQHDEGKCPARGELAQLRETLRLRTEALARVSESTHQTNTTEDQR